MPQVTWWRDSHLIDSSFERTFSRTVQNTLSVPQVSREDLGASLTCQASNNNISAPASSRVAIDLKCELLCSICWSDACQRQQQPLEWNWLSFEDFSIPLSGFRSTLDHLEMTKARVCIVLIFMTLCILNGYITSYFYSSPWECQNTFQEGTTFSWKRLPFGM